MKGETVEELAAAARVMRDLAAKEQAEPDGLVDTAGTGGDVAETFNVSTVAALIAAGAGVRVAKHGNRAGSSRSGSADVLEGAGVNLNLSPEQVAECIRRVGIGFMFAPHHHSAMRYAVGPRREMGARTVFNLLGPLTNPAGAPNQIMGVFAPEWVGPIAHVLHELGSRHVLVYHSEDGLDEISIGAPTRVAELRDGEVREYGVTPEALGVERSATDAIPGREPRGERRDDEGRARRPSRPPPRHRAPQRRRRDLRLGPGGEPRGGRRGGARGGRERGRARRARAARRGLERPRRGLNDPLRHREDRSASMSGIPDILARILERKREEVEAGKRGTPLGEMRRRAADAPPARGFRAALETRVEAGEPAVIAEIKRASPSRGLIREDFDPARVAAGYERGGAAALSVLTDREFFRGSPEHLAAARAATNLPVLRKDFMVDPWQFYETRSMGADCALLIVAALDDRQLHEFAGLAAALGLDALVEVHEETELERALRVPAPLVGINNRDLRTFTTDLGTTRSLAARVPDDRLTVTESGIATRDDVADMRRHGVHAFLVGEALMSAPDPGERLTALFGDGDR